MLISQPFYILTKFFKRTIIFQHQVHCVLYFYVCKISTEHWVQPWQ